MISFEDLSVSANLKKLSGEELSQESLYEGLTHAPYLCFHWFQEPFQQIYPTCILKVLSVLRAFPQKINSLFFS